MCVEFVVMYRVYTARRHRQESVEGCRSTYGIFLTELRLSASDWPVFWTPQVSQVPEESWERPALAQIFVSVVQTNTITWQVTLKSPIFELTGVFSGRLGNIPFFYMSNTSLLSYI